MVHFLDVVESSIVLIAQRNLLLTMWDQSNVQVLDCIFMDTTGEKKNHLYF